MNRSLGAFRAALVAGWVVLGAAGWWLARDKGIPNWAALPVLAAFLVEYPFYLAAGFAELRERFAGARLPFWLASTAALPYLVSCWGTGTFSWIALARLMALALALALWYSVFPAKPLADLGFLALVAAVMIGKYFNHIYVPAYPGLEVAILGHLTLIRTSALVLLLARRLEPAGFGFWPSRQDWREGLAHYLYFLPLGFPLGLALGAIRFGPLPPAWRIVATFFGILWVVALSEELFFRGALQRWIEHWSGKPLVALVAASLLFGSVHLPFRHFPNWRFAAMAAVAGFFYGCAFRRTGSIRASMVTHALVVTTWRALFI